MYVRQRVLLNLLLESGGRMSRSRLVILAFLYAHDGLKKPPAASVYQFLPYRNGPYSFTLRRDLRKLVGEGHLLVLPRRELSLPGEAVPESAVLPGGLARRVRHFVWLYGGLSLTQLVGLIHEQNAWFAMSGTLRDQWAVRPPPAKCAIYTAGCEGRQVDGFIDLLLRRGIKSLVDVRADPESRRYGFDGKTLPRICRRLGIRYRHLPQLGVPPAWRPKPQGSSDYGQQFFERRVRRVLEQEGGVLAQLGRMMSSTPAVLLGEADPRRGHCSRLAETLSEMTGLERRDLGGRVHDPGAVT